MRKWPVEINGKKFLYQAWSYVTAVHRALLDHQEENGKFLEAEPLNVKVFPHQKPARNKKHVAPAAASSEEPQTPVDAVQGTENAPL